METLMTGIAFGESPRWHEGRLWFSNWGTQEIGAVDLDGNARSSDTVPWVSGGPPRGYPTGACSSPARSSCAGSVTGRWFGMPT